MQPFSLTIYDINWRLLRLSLLQRAALYLFGFMMIALVHYSCLIARVRLEYVLLAYEPQFQEVHNLRFIGRTGTWGSLAIAFTIIIVLPLLVVDFIPPKWLKAILFVLFTATAFTVIEIYYLTQTFRPPESAGFWDLPSFAEVRRDMSLLERLVFGGLVDSAESGRLWSYFLTYTIAVSVGLVAGVQSFFYFLSRLLSGGVKRLRKIK